MNERFTYSHWSQTITDKKTGKRYYGNQQLTKLLNQLDKQNTKLLNDNYTPLALLGDIRAILRTKDINTAIKKINQLEKEMIQ